MFRSYPLAIQVLYTICTLLNAHLLRLSVCLMQKISLFARVLADFFSSVCDRMKKLLYAEKWRAPFQCVPAIMSGSHTCSNSKLLLTLSFSVKNVGTFQRLNTFSNFDIWWDCLSISFDFLSYFVQIRIVSLGKRTLQCSSGKSKFCIHWNYEIIEVRNASPSSQISWIKMEIW